MMEKFKDFDVSKLTPVYPTFDYETIKRQMQEYIKDVKVEPVIPNGYFEKTQKYQHKSLEVLQSINENTANFYTIVELISQSNDK